MVVLDFGRGVGLAPGSMTGRFISLRVAVGKSEREHAWLFIQGMSLL